MIPDAWIDFLKLNLFNSKNGFFEVNYLSNSPTTIFNSLLVYPAISNYLISNSLEIDNDFFEGVISFQEIEQELWLYDFKAHLKNNVLAKTLFIENEPSIYYYLTFSNFEYDFPFAETAKFSNKLISRCWVFLSPETKMDTYFYKGTTGHFYTVAFSQAWVKKNCFKDDNMTTDEIMRFFNNNICFLSWIRTSLEIENKSYEILNLLKTDRISDKNLLKDKITDFIKVFFETAVLEKRIENFIPLNNSDFLKVSLAESFILNNLSQPFLGINKIASLVNSSPTKLKMMFKSVFGFSILQYHKEKNIQLADQLLKKSDIQFKHISKIVGFMSASKFAAAYKKRFGYLPSANR